MLRHHSRMSFAVRGLLILSGGVLAGSPATAEDELDVTSALFGGVLSGKTASEAGQMLGVFPTDLGRGGVFADGATLKVLVPVATGQPNEVVIQTVSAFAGAVIYEARFIGSGLSGGAPYRAWMVRTVEGLGVAYLTGSGPYQLAITPFIEGSFGDFFAPGVAVGDVDGDGLPEVVIVNRSTGQVGVCQTNANGATLAPEYTQTAAPADALRSVVLTDFDGDGDLDIGALTSPGGLYPLENDGQGLFAPFSQNGPGTSFGADTRSAAAADFNGDGITDVYKLSAAGQGQLLIGDGEGAFTPGPTNSLPSGAANPVAGDFNNDGHPDIVTPNSGADSLAFLRGDGLGALTLTQLAPTGDGPVVALPIVGDGPDPDIDLVVSHSGAFFPQGPIFVEDVSRLSTITFESYQLRSQSDARSMAVADFTGDGRRDVVVGTNNNWLRIYPGVESGISASNTIVSTNAPFQKLKPLPIPGNPRAALALLNPAAPLVAVMRYDLNTGMMEYVDTATPGFGAIDLTNGDTNGDGILDVILLLASGEPACEFFPCDAAGELGAPVGLNGPTGGTAVLAQDFVDGEGGLDDLLIATAAELHYSAQLASGVFSPWTTVPVADAPTIHRVVVGEFDETPGPDAMIAAADEDDENGRLVFVPQLLSPGPAAVFPLPGVPTDLAAQDIDGDGSINFLFTLDMLGFADTLADWDPEPAQIAAGPAQVNFHQTVDKPSQIVIADIHETVGERAAPERGQLPRPAPEAIVLNLGNSAIGPRGVTINLNLSEIDAGQPCPGDVNGDGFIGFADLNAVVSAFNTSSGEPGYNAAADIDDDGDVDFGDLNVVLSGFNTEC